MSLTQYAVAPGWNVAEISLTVLTPQPASPDGVVPSDMEYYGNRSVQPLGFENEMLIWSAVNQAERNAVLTLIGLTEAAPSKDVTFMLLLNSRGWQRCNVTAVWQRGTDKRAKFGVNNLSVLLMGIEPSS